MAVGPSCGKQTHILAARPNPGPPGYCSAHGGSALATRARQLRHGLAAQWRRLQGTTLPAHVLAGLVWETLARSDMWGRVSDATGTELLKLREIVLAMVECAPKRAANPRPFGDVLDAQAAEGEMRAKVAAQDAQGPSSDALGAALDRLRRADLGEIAREVNLEEDAVRRVLDRLLSEPMPEAEPAVRNAV